MDTAGHIEINLLAIAFLYKTFIGEIANISETIVQKILGKFNFLSYCLIYLDIFSKFLC